MFAYTNLKCCKSYAELVSLGQQSGPAIWRSELKRGCTALTICVITERRGAKTNKKRVRQSTTKLNNTTSVSLNLDLLEAEKG